MSDVIERTRAAAAADARRHPRKARMLLVRIREKDIDAARARGHLEEVARLEALAEGIEAELGITAAKCCREPGCGRPLSDESQPGYAEGYGPDCWAKRQRNG